MEVRRRHRTCSALMRARHHLVTLPNAAALLALHISCVGCRPSSRTRVEEAVPDWSVASEQGNVTAASCLLGTVDDCAACGDRCLSGCCQQGHCVQLPKPFAHEAPGRLVTLTPQGPLFARRRLSGFGYWPVFEYHRHLFSGVSEALPGLLRMGAIAYGGGKLFGLSEGLKVAEIDSSGQEQRVLATLSPVPVGEDRFTMLADESGVLLFSFWRTVHITRPGTVRSWGRTSFKVATGPGGFFAIHDHEPVRLPFSEDRREHLSLLKWFEPWHSKNPRVVASGERIGAAAFASGWTFFSDRDSVFCLRNGDEEPRRVIRMPGFGLLELGTIDDRLFVGAARTGNEPPEEWRSLKHELYSFELPLCGDGMAAK